METNFDKPLEQEMNENSEAIAGIGSQLTNKIRFVVIRNGNSFSFDVGTSNAATALVFNGNQSVAGYFELTGLNSSPSVTYRNLTGTSETWTISKSGTVATLTRSAGTMWGMACLIVALE